MIHNLFQTRNFFDPALTSDGKPYRPQRYKEIVKERYLISKHTGMSYNDSADMTPQERTMVLSFVVEDYKKIEEMRDAQKDSDRR